MTVWGGASCLQFTRTKQFLQTMLRHIDSSYGIAEGYFLFCKGKNCKLHFTLLTLSDREHFPDMSVTDSFAPTCILNKMLAKQ